MNKYNPEPLERLKLRYSKALEELYIQLDVSRGIRVRPGSQPSNVFDFADGIRLIISKEQQPDGRLVIHISGSAMGSDGHPIKLTDNLIHHIVEHYGLISGNLGSLEVVGISHESIIHLYYRLDN